MNRSELIGVLGERGADEWNPWYEGFIGWELGYENGHRVLTVRSTIYGEEDDPSSTHEAKWIMTPVGEN